MSMRSKSFSRFFRDRSDVNVTTSLIPAIMQSVSDLEERKKKEEKRLTRILGILRAHIIITSIQNILIHKRRPRRNLSKKANLNRLANLNTLPLLHKDLARVLAPILAVQARNTVLLWMVTLLEGLQRGHEVVSACDAVRDDALGDAGCDGAFDDGCDRVHGADDFGLELRGHVEFDLLEEVF